MDIFFSNSITLTLVDVTLPIYHHLLPHLQNASPFFLRAYPLFLQAYNSLSTVLRPVYINLLTAFSPIFLPMLDAILQSAKSSPGIFGVGVLVLLVWGVLYLMSLMRRLVAFGVRLALGIVFWGALGVVALIVWERGVGRSGAQALAWGMGCVDTFWEEYRKAMKEEGKRSRY